MLKNWGNRRNTVVVIVEGCCFVVDCFVGTLTIPDVDVAMVGSLTVSYPIVCDFLARER